MRSTVIKMNRAKELVVETNNERHARVDQSGPNVLPRLVFPGADIFAYPRMTIAVHHNWGRIKHAEIGGKEPFSATHEKIDPVAVDGYQTQHAKTFTENLFDLAMRDPEKGGAKDVVVTLPQADEEAPFLRVVIQSKDAGDKAYKKQVGEVVGRFMTAQAAWASKRQLA